MASPKYVPMTAVSCVLAVMFTAGIVYTSFIIVEFNNTTCVCYEYDKINNYGEKHPYCNGKYLNNSKFNEFVNPPSFTCQDSFCPSYKCIADSIINIGATDVRFKMCYEDVDKEMLRVDLRGSDCHSNKDGVIGYICIIVVCCLGLLLALVLAGAAVHEKFFK